MNDGWSSLFPNANLEHCNINHSDHRPLLVDTDFYQGTTPIQEGPKRFEARWLREANFSDLVQETWDKAGADPNVSGIFQKLSRMHSEFHDWDQRVLKKSKKRLWKAQRDLEQVMTGPMTDENEIKRKELAELLENL